MCILSLHKHSGVSEASGTPQAFPNICKRCDYVNGLSCLLRRAGIGIPRDHLFSSTPNQAEKSCGNVVALKTGKRRGEIHVGMQTDLIVCLPALSRPSGRRWQAARAMHQMTVIEGIYSFKGH